jgi:hypothetical protein
MTPDKELPADQRPFEFIPSTVEATGRLGHAANHFINWICGAEHTDSRTYFYNSISLNVTKFAFRMLETTRGRIQPHRVHP